MGQLKTKDLTTIAMIVVLMIVGGGVLFSAGTIVGLPGMKYLLMGPYLTFCLYFPNTLIRHPMILSIVSAVFGMIMMLVSPFMGPAILVTGLVTDLIARLFHLKSAWKLALYPAVGFFLTYYVTTHLTGLMLLGPMGWPLAVLLTLLTFALGLLGERAARMIHNRLKNADLYS
jgi:hypothetical protein